MNKEEIVKCSKCGKKFVLIYIKYSSNCDDKRDSYYCCPYCGDATMVHLLGTEDVDTRKIDNDRD